MYDVTVIGAGLAGLQVARLLARAGAKVLIADAKRNVTDFVRTTGIFVRRTIEDFRVLEPYLGPAVRAVRIHSPRGQSIGLTSGHDEFRVGRMKPLYAAMLGGATSAGAEWRPSTAYAGLVIDRDVTRVEFRDGSSVRSRFIVGADGARSLVARDLGLSANRRFITGVENVYPSSAESEPRFDCWIDPGIAPGYLAWLVDDGQEIHVGVGGRPQSFDPSEALQRFEQRLRSEGRLGESPRLERRGGLIPVGGILPRIATRRELLVGDAAGAVSPLTAGGLDACMRLSLHASEVLLEALSRGTGIDGYDGSDYRARFASRIVMRHLFDLVTRSPLAIELGFTAGRWAMGNRFVRHVFFGRGSFPDITARPPRRGALSDLV
jgi:flavin-dependent dehydrogenase